MPPLNLWKNARHQRGFELPPPGAADIAKQEIFAEYLYILWAKLPLPSRKMPPRKCLKKALGNFLHQ